MGALTLYLELYLRQAVLCAHDTEMDIRAHIRSIHFSIKQVELRLYFSNSFSTTDNQKCPCCVSYIYQVQLITTITVIYWHFANRYIYISVSPI